MKRILFALMAVVLCVSLCACGRSNIPDGTYEDVATGLITITFEGDDVIISTGGFESYGTFTVEEDVIKITMNEGSTFTYDTLTYNADDDTLGFGGATVFKKAE